jgi:endonuclease/exonuclease/phosphatase family metal-dependent hydrolase
MRTALALFALICAVLVPACGGIEKRPGLYELVTGAASPGVELTCVTFSLAGDAPDDGPNAWRLREAFVAEIISAQRADVVALQRITPAQARDLAARLEGLTLIARDTETPGAALLVRSARWTMATPQKVEQGGSSAILVTLTPRDGGTTIDALALDLADGRAEDRAALVSRIGEALGKGPRPAVVMGGFAGDAVVPIRAQGYIDAWRLAYPDSNDGTKHDFTGQRDGPRTDAVLVPKGSLVLNAATIGVSRAGRYPSDHFPVVTQVKVLERR